MRRKHFFGVFVRLFLFRFTHTLLLICSFSLSPSGGVFFSSTSAQRNLSLATAATSSDRSSMAKWLDKGGVGCLLHKHTCINEMLGVLDGTHVQALLP